MEAIPNDLARAALAARDHLSDLARTAARGNAEPSSAAGSTMALAARAAIFADALTSAIHARLEELKIVAK